MHLLFVVPQQMLQTARYLIGDLSAHRLTSGGTSAAVPAATTKQPSNHELHNNLNHNLFHRTTSKRTPDSPGECHDTSVAALLTRRHSALAAPHPATFLFASRPGYCLSTEMQILSVAH